jgi:predicted ATPase/class 3 adenylate cyclase
MASGLPAPAPLDGAALPTGTVTFLFTDIEGSTQRWDAHGEAMSAAVQRHDAIGRAAMNAHGGYVFKTVGDAFCVAFTRSDAAVAAALDLQRALAAEDFTAVGGLRVRAALHTGAANERGGDYFGSTVNRVARLLSIGHGGQTLLSGVMHDLVLGALPQQASLRDLGEHRLKDLSRPEYVYQLLAPGLASEFPALRSLESLPNNLPLQMTSFVGRDREVAEIAELLGTHRLVTLVGSGGIGKTRTSLQVAANLLNGSGNGVWFIELAPLGSGDYIPAAIAQAIGLSLPPEGDSVAHLVKTLKAWHALLVFDNCEHLIDGSAKSIAALLRGCPKVSVLASSRQGLGIAGEGTYRLPSLAVGDAVTEGLSAADVAAAPAIALFVERAISADHRFALTDENASTIAEICRRLDGIPLAIELAAARVKMLSPQQLRERLDERFRILTGGSRDVLPRQQTLRALIDWSYDLLDDRERMLFRRLGIFVNGFALEAATAIGTSDDLDELDLFDVLASLVDKSLVLAEPAGDALRYRMLESTRAYAREKLDVAAESQERALRHLRHLHDRFAEERERFMQTGREELCERLIAIELEDVRAALDWGMANSEAVLASELLVAVRRDWYGVALTGEGYERIANAIELLGDGAAASLRSALFTWRGVFASDFDRITEACDFTSEGVRLGRASGDRTTLAIALLYQSIAVRRAGRIDDAADANAEAETLISREDRWLALSALENKSVLVGMRGDYENAVRLCQELRDKHRALGNRSLAIVPGLNLAEFEHALGKTERAVVILQETLADMKSAPTRYERLSVVGASNLIAYLVALDRLTEARATARELLLRHGSDAIHFGQISRALETLALVLALGGDYTRAAQLAAHADATLRDLGCEREFAEKATRTRLDGLLAERLPSDQRESLLARGAAMRNEEAVALALSALEEPPDGV